MTATRTPADIAVAFIEAFGRQDTAAVAGLLADDVVFESPRAAISGKEEVAAAIGAFARAVTGVRIISALGDDTRATIVYDMVTGPFGTLRAADHLTIRAGRIASDLLIFDTRPLQAAAARPAE